MRCPSCNKAMHIKYLFRYRFPASKTFKKHIVTNYIIWYGHWECKNKHVLERKDHPSSFRDVQVILR